MSKSDTIWTAIDAIKATGGICSSDDWSVSGVSIDTRTLQEGDLFVALVGGKSDGHAYVKAAFDKGAVVALVTKEIEGVSADKLLIVEDTLKAMQDLARAARARTAAKVIGVTGSVGKTSTKEMLHTAFEKQGQAHTSIKGYNYRWSVPLALSSMHAGTDYGVVEMGMSSPNEIAPLSHMVKPDIAIITNILKHPAYSDDFDGGVDGVVAAKAEIFDGMVAGSAVILNHDNEAFESLKQKAQSENLIVYSFGEHENADARIIDCLEAANGSRVQADIIGEEVSFSLQVVGRHVACHALAVLLAVKLAGADVQQAAKALMKKEPVVGRGKRKILDSCVANNPITLIDESRNASPLAMNAAFKVLALVDPGRGGRRIAILGDMLEMGGGNGKMHADLALPLKASNVDLVYTCGQHMRKLYDELPANQRGAHKETSQELAEIVPDVLVPGDVVMVKGSLESKMGLVVEALRALPKKVAKTKTVIKAITKEKV